MDNNLILTSNELTSCNEGLFELFLHDTSIAPKTLKNYVTFLKPFMVWTSKNGINIENITRNNIRDYRKSIDLMTSERTGKPISELTKQQYFQVVKTFFKFLENEGICHNITNGIKSFKVDKTEERRRAFLPVELQAIADSIDTSSDVGKRNKAMFFLMVDLGLRAIEIQRANIEDIEIINGIARLSIQGKGKKDKNVQKKIPRETYELILDYLTTRPNVKKCEPLFVGTTNHKGERFDSTSISRLFKNLFKKCGFDSHKLTTHSLRHSSNYALYQLTGDVEKTRRHARHSSISTTQIYINHANDESEFFEQDIHNEIFKDSQSNNDTMKQSCNQPINEKELCSLSNEELIQMVKNLQEQMKGGVVNA